MREDFNPVEQVLTIVCKLQPNDEQLQKMQITAQRFANACNYINQVVPAKKTRRNAIQELMYDAVRQQFSLPANLAVRAVARVSSNRKTAKHKGKPVKTFKATSVDYDQRVFTFRERDWSVSLATVEGRIKVPILVGNYQRGKLTGKNPTSAQLCLYSDRHWYIHIQVKDTAPKPNQSTKASAVSDFGEASTELTEVRTVIGIDFGRREIAKTSTNRGWDGTQIQEVRDRYSRVRALLQATASQGTRSTRRRCRQTLQRLSGRERRYQQWLNYQISKSIVQEAVQSQSIIAIEDLTGIRGRTNQQPRNKTERRRSNSWAFFQLRQFLSYKAIQASVKVVAVPPQYTSQTCNCCLHIGIRTNKRFKCINCVCGWVGDSDWNGALNIAALGLSVNQPDRGSYLACQVQGYQKPLALVTG